MIRRFFEKDSVLKVVSVFVALLVWLYVIYIEDPEVEITVDDIPVSYKAAELPDDLSLVEYDIKTVDVKISGNRSDIIQFENEEIVAFLDLSTVSEAGKYDNIKIDVSTSNKKVEIVERSEKKSNVQIDEIISKKIAVGVELSGETPEGYVIASEPIMFIDTTTITGAKSFVESVSNAFIKVDCTKLTQSETVASEIYLLDDNDNVIDEKHPAYKHLSIDTKMASAYITVAKTKAVDIVITDAQEDKKHTISPSKVDVYSKNNSTDVIYTESIKGKRADKDGNIELKLIIPDNVIIASGETSVTVKVKNN